MGPLLTIRVHALVRGIGPVGKHRSIKRFKPNQPPAQRVRHMFAFLRPFPEKIVFPLGNRPMKPEILRRHRPISLVTDHDEALLSAHDVQSLGSVRRHAEGPSGLQEPVPKRPGLTGRRSDLEGQLTREGNAKDTHGNVAERTVRPGHERKRLLAEVHGRPKFVQQIPCPRTCHTDLGELFGDIGYVHFPVPPFRLEPFFH